MTADKKPLADQELDALLAAARREAPEPPEALMSAVLADAADVAAERRAARPAAQLRTRSAGWFAAMLNGIGGWQGAATVFASGVFGLWVGYADLSALPIVGDLGYQVDLMLDGGAELSPIATFDDFTLDG